MVSFQKCPWTPEEDMILVSYITRYGIGNWTQMPKNAGLSRSGKSCRLRWLNYLNPETKRGNYTAEEDDTIINMLEIWEPAIAATLPGRTDTEIKNRWHTHLKKRFNNNSVENMEPKMEEMMEVVDTDTSNDTDHYSSSSTPAETQYFEEFNEYSPVLSNIISNNAPSNNIVTRPTHETSTDPHISFRRQPFPSEILYHEDNCPTYIDPEFELPMPQQDWFKESFTPCDCCNNYLFNLLTVGRLDDHQ